MGELVIKASPLVHVDRTAPKGETHVVRIWWEHDGKRELFATAYGDSIPMALMRAAIIEAGINKMKPPTEYEYVLRPQNRDDADHRRNSLAP